MPKLLLVEDNEVYSELMQRRLQHSGYEVILATDGPGAIESARRDRPDLIVLDGSLPGFDGWEVSRRLKADPATAMIPIVALTGHSLPEDREAALASGCDEYESKPPMMPRFVAKIQGLLTRPRA
jgi:CheY-like chemotaxis protein